MKTRTAIIVLIIIALAAGLWAAFERGPSQPTCLVPAWQLMPNAAYEGQSSVDPMMSWSPDSRSLLFTAVSMKGYRTSILRWKVGEKQINRIVLGVSPNYIDNNKFVFLGQSSMSIIERNLATGRERDVVPNLRRVDLWREITGFTYDPARKTIALRFSSFTRHYEPGVEQIDLAGKSLGAVERTTGDGVIERSPDPMGGRSAVILGELAGGARELRIARPGEEGKASPVATGNLGALAWSPDGRMVAFADSNEVKVLNASDMKIVTVARFGAPIGSGDGTYVCRLAWSPNSSYLAALDLVPSVDSAYAVLYVLDMSKVRS